MRALRQAQREDVKRGTGPQRTLLRSGSNSYAVTIRGPSQQIINTQ